MTQANAQTVVNPTKNDGPITTSTEKTTSYLTGNKDNGASDWAIGIVAFLIAAYLVWRVVRTRIFPA